MSETEPDLSRFIVVLCRADQAGNVGSACRAMKTMGITRLYLADCPQYKELAVNTMAVHAADLYASALRFDSLAGALAGVGLSAGLTRRRGEKRKNFSIDLPEFAAMALARPAASAQASPAGPAAGGSVQGCADSACAAPAASGADIALVFGNEESGLSDEELNLCSLAVHISSSELFPSLNLAQAVQVVCYELRRQALAGACAPAVGNAAPRLSYVPAATAAVDASVVRVSERLAGLGFFKKNDGEQLRRFLRDMCERAALSPVELRYIENIIQKTASLGCQNPEKTDSED